MLSRIPIFREREFHLEAPVEGEVLLVAKLTGSATTITPVDADRVVAEGKRRRGKAVLRVIQDEEKGLVAEFEGVGVEARIRGPARAVAVSGKASSLRVERGIPVEYISLKVSSSAVKAEALLRPGGGAYIDATSSAVKIVIEPVEEGEYWLEITGRGSSVKVETPPSSSYTVERRGRLSSVSVEEAKRDAVGARYRFRVSVNTVGSSVHLA
ncbi:MAG: hypothetical protein F7C35_09060 [Desulfurococcales archaeon]|nr:hypothetical protein [Desulfurococcales archaeon]